MSPWSLPDQDLLQLVDRRAAPEALELGARLSQADAARLAVGDVVACLEAIVHTADASARRGNA